MQISLAKKLFAVGSAAAMTAALVPTLASAAVHSAGTNCLDSGTVYFINASGQKQPYTSAGAFLSYGTNSWSNVVACSAEDLALPTGSFVTPADGKLYLDTKDGKTVYMITNGQRAGFTNPAALLGLGYSFSKVTPADTSFMTTLAPISTSAMAHPAGTLVNQDGTVFLMGTSGKMGIPSPAVFNSWGYSFNDVVLANSYDRAIAMSGGVMPTQVAGFLNPLALGSNGGNNGGTTPVTPASGITVNLASDNPASGTVVAGQSTADLAHFQFNGSGTVTQLTLNRIGVSANSTLVNVYLYNGNVRITDASSVNSNNQIVFNNTAGLFTSPANISVRADIVSGVSGQSVGVSVASAMSGSNSVSGNPSGNLMTVANPGTGALATTNFTTATNNVVAQNVNAGSLNFTVWGAPLTVSNRSVSLKTAMFKVIGSAPTDALQNYGLFVDGVSVATTNSLVAINGSNYAVFNPSTAFNMITGSHTLEVRADIIKGSARNVTVSLQNAADITLTDTSFNVNITPTVANAAFSALTAGQLSINSGTVSVQLDPAFTATTTIPGGSTNVTLAQFILTGYGEDTQINTLGVGLAGSALTNGINNVALYTDAGQVGSNVQLTAAGTATFTLGSSLIVPAGGTVHLAVKADTIDKNNANITSGTVTATINTGSSNGQGRQSQNTYNVPSGAVAGPSVTIGAAGMTVAANAAYAAQTIAPNTASAKIGSFVVQAGNNEDIRVSNLAVGLTTNGTTVLDTGTTPPLTDLSNLKVSVNGGAASNPIAPQASNNFSQSLVIAKNTTATVDVWADLGSTTSGTVVVTLLPTATGVTSNTSVTVSTAKGQTITIAQGTLAAPTFTASGSSAAQFIAANGGATDATINNFNFTAASGAVTVTELRVSVLGTANSVSSVKVGSVSAPVVTPATTTLTNPSTLTTGSETLTVGSTANMNIGSIITIDTEDMLVTAIPTSTTVTVTHAVDGTTGATHTATTAVTIQGSAFLSGLNIAVPQGAGGVLVNVIPTYASVGINGLASQSTAKVVLSYEKHISGLTTTAQAITPVAANSMVLVGSMPTLTVASSSVNGLTLGENHLMDVTVAASSKGNIQLNTLVFNATETGITTGTLTAPRLAIGSTTIPGVVCTPSGSFVISCAMPSNYVLNAGTSQTFSLFGTVGGTLSTTANGSNVTTSLAAATVFSWADLAGNSTTAITGANTNIQNFPTQSQTIHN